MKIAFTGHTNIEKICNVKYIPDVYNKIAFGLIYRAINNKIIQYMNIHGRENITIISGMARGIDEIAAIVAINQGLNLILAIPHSLEWHKNRGHSNGRRVQALYYNAILQYDKLQIFEIKKDYEEGFIYANFARNAFMVNESDGVLSFKAYDSTGTDHCIKYAKKKNKYLGNIILETEEW